MRPKRWISIDVNTASSNGSFHLKKIRVPEPLREPRTEVLCVPKITVPLGKRARNLSLETANAFINEAHFHTISRMGGAGWFYDQKIDMGFDFITRILDCEKHKIALSNRTAAGDLFMIGHSAAAASEDELTFDTRVAPHFDTDFVTKFVGEDFILFPISEGYSAPISGEQMWTQTLYERSKHAASGPTQHLALAHGQGTHPVHCRLQGRW
jgi:hypothetical protein